VALIVVDASVVIAFLDGDDAHHACAVAALTAGHADRLVIPASAYAEVLVGPIRRGRSMAAVVDLALAHLNVEVVPITREIALRAAGLRASHPSLRLPDALVLATGDLLEATAVLAADRAWQRFGRRVRPI
jgi:predicted nucleic acid-binding protein